MNTLRLEKNSQVDPIHFPMKLHINGVNFVVPAEKVFDAPIVIAKFLLRYKVHNVYLFSLAVEEVDGQLMFSFINTDTPCGCS